MSGSASGGFQWVARCPSSPSEQRVVRNEMPARPLRTARTGKQNTRSAPRESASACCAAAH
eukprot:2662783-Alexandrium_andersonii.AAC.1